MDETEVHREPEARGRLAFYEWIVEQLGSLDHKAQTMIGLEGLLLALIAVFSSTIPSSWSVRVATWAAMFLLLGSALASLLVLRIRWGTWIIANSKNIDEGPVNYRKWRLMSSSAAQAEEGHRPFML
jgi:hypothetical protein